MVFVTLANPKLLPPGTLSGAGPVQVCRLGIYLTSTDGVPAIIAFSIVDGLLHLDS